MSARHSPRGEVTAFAPASVGNVAVGFDILGHSVDAVGDKVTVRRSDSPGVRITQVSGVVPHLPGDPERNTAGRAVLQMHRDLGLAFGLELVIDKGIPIGSGMGGSAASAVAAVVAVNGLLQEPLDQTRLLSYALHGEGVASGNVPAPDNVAPSLYGGLVLVQAGEPLRITRIPVPAAVRCVLVHPHLSIETSEARRLLRLNDELPRFIQQSGNLAGFLAGCYTDDLDLIRASLADVLIEPQRQHLIPGFAAIKQAALDQGALGCSISGSGPSVFAWCEHRDADGVAAAMVAGFAAQGAGTDAWVGAVSANGAAILG